MTQASQIALSGFVAFGVGWNVLAVGVLLMATLTMATIVSVIVHRLRSSPSVASQGVRQRAVRSPR
ncbi:hypothetical protein [Nesterenkonia sp. Act20]|uniref:hypothetical protein n=1 Tax=Nesterenkonia sp. Act20 TaxID=1483432 RepID=UPI001C45BBAF|nr:hypothetical protein [Nesterenkonia sp. Act20]